VIYGLGGVGKSELALQYAHVHYEHYQLTWWITATSPDQIELGLASLGNRLCQSISIAGTTSDAAEWAIGWLQAHDRWLLILDNVENPADVEPLLGQFGRGHVILTTRIDADWSRIADPVRLDLLDFDPAVELLVTRTDRRTPEDLAALAQTVRELGYLPLALDQAAAYMTAQHVAPAAYVQRLRQHPALMYAAGAGGDAQRTTARLWDLHIAAIQAASPVAASVLTVMAWYAPDAIPRVMLGSTSREVTDEALALLARYSLITLMDEVATIHRLLQAVILTRAEASSRDTALAWLGRVLPDDPQRNVAGWPLLRSLVAHAEALADRFPIAERPEQLGFVQNQVAVFLNVQGDYTRELMMCQSALDIYLGALGPNHPYTAACMAHLAVAYRSLGRISEAVPLAEQALRLTETMLGPYHPDTATCLGNLAEMLLKLGRPRQALPLVERALRIVEAALGPEHPDTGRCLGNLAFTYGELGRAADALPLAERALRIEEAALGPDHPSTAIRLGNLAVAYQALGRVDDAVPLAERALGIAEATLGPNHPNTAVLLGNLASTYRKFGRVEDAVPLAERALRITELVLGPDHPDMAFRLWNLAATFRALGRAGDALPLEERAAEIRRRDQQ
jgi:tetratricopeptide (TPR) repeat protein